MSQIALAQARGRCSSAAQARGRCSSAALKLSAVRLLYPLPAAGAPRTSFSNGTVTPQGWNKPFPFSLAQARRVSSSSGGDPSPSSSASTKPATAALETMPSPHQNGQTAVANNILPNGMPPLSPSKRMRSNSSSNLLQEDFGSALMAGALNNPYSGHAHLVAPIAPPKQSLALPSSLLLNAVAAPLPHHHGISTYAPPVAVQQPAAAAVPANSAGGFAADLTKALKSVVKVFCTAASPNYSTPWQMHAQSKSTASGFIVAPASKRQILTNAHAVANQVQVSLRKHGNARKFPARVLAVGHECDLALLTVEDDAFWENTEALEVCEGLPAMQEGVTVVGFPQGGDNVCVTKGVVSRIDRQQYSHGRTSLLAVQIDAAINSGNSGGPVLLDGRVVGIAFQCLTQGENIGYIIPVPVVHHFLNDLKLHQGNYTGFCELGACWMSLESPDMRACLGLPSNLSGVYITHLEPLYHAAKVLRAGDVLTHFNGHAIADDGTFSCPTAGAVRIDFRHLVAMNYEGDAARVRVWRQGEGHVELCVQVHAPKQLVPVHSHDVRPSYYIYAGMVFVALSNFYLRSTYGADWAHKAPIKLCDRSFAGEQELAGQEVVVLAKVLASDCNLGYQDLGNVQVCAVNGHKVHSLAHLARLLEAMHGNGGSGAPTFATAAGDIASQRQFVRFELEWHKMVVVDHAKATRSEQGILQQNCIPARCSPVLLECPLPAGLPGVAAAAPAPSPQRLPAVALSPPASPLTPAVAPDFDAAVGMEAEAVAGRRGVRPESLFSPSKGGMAAGAALPPRSPGPVPPNAGPASAAGDDDADDAASVSSLASSLNFSTATDSKRVAGAGPNVTGEEADSPAKGAPEPQGGLGDHGELMLQGEAAQRLLSPVKPKKAPKSSQQQYTAEVEAAAEGISKL